MRAVLEQPRVKRLLSSDHFSVDGTLIEAWASMKSFMPKDGAHEPPAEGGARNREVNCRGQRCSNDTHASPTDPEAMLYRKGPGKETKLCFMGRALMENRNGLMVDACLTPADGHAERIAALHMIEPRADRPQAITLGADKAYDKEDFVNELRSMKVTPHVALEIAEERKNAPETPRKILRTESDLRLNLFVGSSPSQPYSKTEIEALRIFCRSEGRTDIQKQGNVDAYFRALTIIRTWADWQDNIRREEERSGYAQAEAADCAIADEHAALLSQIALMEPATIEGVFGKAKAARWIMPGISAAEQSEVDNAQLEASLREFRPDQDVMRMSFVRDLFELEAREV
jgi:hypothetical protein